MTPKMGKNGARRISEEVLEAILHENTQNSDLAVIYYTSGMSGTSKINYFGRPWVLKWSKRASKNIP